MLYSFSENCINKCLLVPKIMGASEAPPLRYQRHKTRSDSPLSKSKFSTPICSWRQKHHQSTFRCVTCFLAKNFEYFFWLWPEINSLRENAISMTLASRDLHWDDVISANLMTKKRTNWYFITSSNATLRYMEMLRGPHARFFNVVTRWHLCRQFWHMS